MKRPKKQILISIALLLFLVPSLSGGQSSGHENLNAETIAAAKKLGASLLSEVSFDKGSYDLKAEESIEVKNAINEARRNGAIKEVKIVSWSDREYPNEKEKDTNPTVKLADRRAEEIRRYLLQELNVPKVKKYNMAKRPSGLQEIFKTQNARVKNTLERSGAAPTSPNEGLNYNGKASTALVLIYLK